MICHFGFAYNVKPQTTKYINFTILNKPLDSLQKFWEKLSVRKETN